MDLRRGLPYFEFSRDWVDNGLDISPLNASIKLPQSLRPIYGASEKIYQKLPPFLADSLPDSWGNELFEQWRQHQGIQTVSDPDAVLCATVFCEALFKSPILFSFNIPAMQENPIKRLSQFPIQFLFHRFKAYKRNFQDVPCSSAQFQPNCFSALYPFCFQYVKQNGHVVKRS